MTIEEASKKYNIPIHILKEYEIWGLCQEVKKVMGSWQYDETDFERLSLIMMLYGLDFTVEEIKKYMKLSLEKNERECLKLLNKKRKGGSLKCRLFIYTLANFFLLMIAIFRQI